VVVPLHSPHVSATGHVSACGRAVQPSDLSTQPSCESCFLSSCNQRCMPLRHASTVNHVPRVCYDKEGRVPCKHGHAHVPSGCHSITIQTKVRTQMDRLTALTASHWMDTRKGMHAVCMHGANPHYIHLQSIGVVRAVNKCDVVNRNPVRRLQWFQSRTSNRRVWSRAHPVRELSRTIVCGSCCHSCQAHRNDPHTRREPRSHCDKQSE
jgi:hypothetical protein